MSEHPAPHARCNQLQTKANGGHFMAERVAVVTDTNCGLTPEDARALGAYAVPMPFTIDGAEYFEGVNLTADWFYERQGAGAEVSTSQPLPADLDKEWRAALEDHEELVYIPMSSGLSGSCASATNFANLYDGRVHVIDNKRISVTQREAVIDALRWARAGLDAAQIEQRLMESALQASIYLTVSTLDHLRKSGRITPAVASIGSVLKIKPVLQIQGAKLDAYSVARSMPSAERIMLKALERDVNERFGGVENVHLYVAHTNREKEACDLAERVSTLFGGHEEVFMDRLPLSIACHTGAGAIGVGCARREA